MKCQKRKENKRIITPNVRGGQRKGLRDQKVSIFQVSPWAQRLRDRSFLLFLPPAAPWPHPCWPDLLGSS